MLRISFVGTVNEPSAYKIPSLLLPEVAFRQPWPPDSMPVHAEAAHLDGVACFVIDSTFQDCARRSWIEQDALLVRRISDRSVFDEHSRQKMISSFESELASHDLEAERRHTLEQILEVTRQPSEPFVVEETTTWTPRMDIVIDPQVFEFVPE